MTILAAIDIVLKLLGALIATKPSESEDYSRVSELLAQLKTLGEEALGRLLQRMNYVRELLTRSTLPTLEDLKAFLNRVVQIINCDARPLVHDGWKVEEHRKGGKLEWNPEKIQIYLSNGQKGDSCVEGHKLRKELKPKKVLNACVLDWLLANPEFIPEEWKEYYIYFWGTIYRDSDGNLGVRGLYWFDGGWCWYCRGLGNSWFSNGPAAVLAEAV